MAKKKYYVVWKGRKTGLFENWHECKEQIHEFPDAEYKSFPTRHLAEQACNNGSNNYLGKTFFKTELTEEQIKLIGYPITDSIVVDAAWNISTGAVEYKGIDLKTGNHIFHQGPFEDGTNNIVEFLVIVHALAYCKQNNIRVPIYSDSRNAIKWVKDKEARTNHDKTEKNKKLFEMIDRAIKWLNENKYSNQLLKWETKAWGENPADFGRK